MKKIEAVIQPFKLDDVKHALEAIGIDGMTITDVRGHGRQKGHKEVYRGQEYTVDFSPRVKVDIVVQDSRVHEVIAVITGAAQTGHAGDGSILVSSLEDAVSIQNGKHVNGDSGSPTRSS